METSPTSSEPAPACSKPSARAWEASRRAVRQEPDHFGDLELVLLYIAKRLKEAQALERLFTDAGVDYLVEPDEYSGGIIFRSQRVGAFFYVAPAEEAAAREVMRVGGYRPYAVQK